METPLPLPPPLPEELVRDGGEEPVEVPVLALAGGEEAEAMLLLLALVLGGDEEEETCVVLDAAGGLTAGGGPCAAADVASRKRARPFSMVVVIPLMLGRAFVSVCFLLRVTSWNERMGQGQPEQ